MTNQVFAALFQEPVRNVLPRSDHIKLGMVENVEEIP